MSEILVLTPVLSFRKLSKIVGLLQNIRVSDKVVFNNYTLKKFKSCGPMSVKYTKN